MLDSSDRPAYLDSLAAIRELDFEVLVPWGATAGRPYHAVTSTATHAAASTRSSTACAAARTADADHSREADHERRPKICRKNRKMLRTSMKIAAASGIASSLPARRSRLKSTTV